LGPWAQGEPAVVDRGRGGEAAPVEVPLGGRLHNPRGGGGRRRHPRLGAMGAARGEQQRQRQRGQGGANWFGHACLPWDSLRLANRRYREGTTNRLSRVEVNRPPRITTASGCSISWPGVPPATTGATTPTPAPSAA